jgi:hypothetical protein
MSSSAIFGLSGIAPTPSDPTFAAIQAAAKPQATSAPAPAAPAFNGVQPILLVPTKPPLSAAVMAELLGQQTSPFGSAGGENARDQNPVHGTTTMSNIQPVPSLG